MKSTTFTESFLLLWKNWFCSQFRFCCLAQCFYEQLTDIHRFFYRMFNPWLRCHIWAPTYNDSVRVQAKPANTFTSFTWTNLIWVLLHVQQKLWELNKLKTSSKQAKIKTLCCISSQSITKERSQRSCWHSLNIFRTSWWTIQARWLWVHVSAVKLVSKKWSFLN